MDTLLYYKEAKNGQILEEGITEAGSMASFIAAGTAYANHGVNMIPFYIYYSMFGFQRIGDLIWAAADSACARLSVGGTAGRTTLAGEGLQHQDGHSHVLRSPCRTARLRSCLRLRTRRDHSKTVFERMYVDQESIFYYLTVYQRALAHAPHACGRGHSRWSAERHVSASSSAASQTPSCARNCSAAAPSCTKC